MDTNGFIRHSNLIELAIKYDLVTTEGIVCEIKDA